MVLLLYRTILRNEIVGTLWCPPLSLPEAVDAAEPEEKEGEEEDRLEDGVHDPSLQDQKKS